MMEHGLVKTAIEAGLSIGVFALCVWLVVTIVRRLCGTMDKLENKFERFTDRVKEEHDQSKTRQEIFLENQQRITEQHVEIITTLGRINGYKT